MPKLIVEEQKDYPVLPVDSIIHIKVDSLEVRTVRGERGDWDKLEFKCKILGIYNVPNDHPSNYDLLIGERIYGSCPYKLTDSQENKLRLWSEALLGMQLPLGYELDTDYLLNREARAVTSQYDKRAINPVTRQPYKAHQIQALLPLGELGQGPIVGAAQVQQQPVQQQPQAWGQPQQQPQPVAAQPPTQDPWAPQQPFNEEPPF